MKQRKILSLALALTMIISIVSAGCISASAAGGITNAGGWFESAYAEWSAIDGADGYNVYYSNDGSRWTKIDGELIRKYNGGYRADAVGLAAGNYTLKVVPTKGGVEQGGALFTDTIAVMAYDRSGYAHFNYTQGVGAYNDDGTLKDNAIVLYVTNENKDSVSVTSKDGTTVVGIGNILNSVGANVGGGKAANGGKANSNSDILRKLAKDGTPLVVRIVGRVSAPAGLTAFDSLDNGGSKGDNGYMARMSGGLNITIEGIGADATIDGWGLHFICNTGDYAKGYGRSFEVRNIAFRNVPEDCVGMEGQQEGSALTAPVERCWIHHCSFYAPTIANPAESDKDGGDGACDFKRGQYFTNSYCYYEGYHKTNLVGSSDTALQYHITYHHNYWKNCTSRGPLGRQANIHMYNNIFEGQTDYAMNTRAGCYIFSEYNQLFECKNPVRVDDGAVKSYNDSFTGCVEANGATVVTDKSAKVSSSNKYANFDTNSSISYIPSGDYILQESIAEMRAVVLAYAGHQKANVTTPDEVNVSLIPSDYYPTEAVKIDYSKTLNNSTVSSAKGVYDNVVYNLKGVGKDHILLGNSRGRDVVFYVDTEVDITITESSSTKNQSVLCNAWGETILVGGGTVRSLPSGYYFIQSAYCNPGKSEYKEVKLAAISITAVDPNATPDPIPTPPPAGGDDNPDQGGDTPVNPDQGGDTPVNPDQGGNNQGGTTIPTGSVVHNITENGLTDPSGFFSLSGSSSDSKGNVSFSGLTLTTCLKVSSKAYVRFTSPADGRLTLVFNSSCAGYTLKINGSSVSIPSDGIVILDVSGGVSYEVLKNSGESFLYYLAYTPLATEEHKHNYVLTENIDSTCTESGSATYTCECGEGYTETISAVGHSYVDGVCSGCGDVIETPPVEDDPTPPVEGDPTPPAEDDPTPPVEDDPTPPVEDDPTPPVEDDPTPPVEDDSTPPAEEDTTSPEEPEKELNFFEWLWKAIIDFFKALFGIKD